MMSLPFAYVSAFELRFRRDRYRGRLLIIIVICPIIRGMLINAFEGEIESEEKIDCSHSRIDELKHRIQYESRFECILLLVQRVTSTVFSLHASHQEVNCIVRLNQLIWQLATITTINKGTIIWFDAHPLFVRVHLIILPVDQSAT